MDKTHCPDSPVFMQPKHHARVHFAHIKGMTLISKIHSILVHIDHLSLWILANMIQCCPICVNMGQYRSMSVNIGQYRSTKANIDQYESIGVDIGQYRPGLVSMNQYWPVQANMVQNRPIRARMDRSWQIVAYTVQHCSTLANVDLYLYVHWATMIYIDPILTRIGQY